MDEVILVLCRDKHIKAYMNGEFLEGCTDIEDLGKFGKKEVLENEIKYTFHGYFAFENGILRKKIDIHNVM